MYKGKTHKFTNTRKKKEQMQEEQQNIKEIQSKLTRDIQNNPRVKKKLEQNDSASQMSGRVVEHGVPHIRLRKHRLQLQMRPVMCRKMLKEHHHLLKIELLQSVRPLPYKNELRYDAPQLGIWIGICTLIRFREKTSVGLLSTNNFGFLIIKNELVECPT